MRKEVKINRNKLRKKQSKLVLLAHIRKHNCALLPYLSDESLHVLGEFLFNVITQNLKLDSKQLSKVKQILSKDKSFYIKLIDDKTKYPAQLLRKKLVSSPQIGKGIVSLIATLAPIIATLLSRI